MNNFEKAVALAEAGYHVFPTNGWAPLANTNGHLEATTDIQQIKNWWATGDYHVSVNTGRSGVVVCDVDRKNGKDGSRTLEDNWLELPDTFHYVTKNGGEHHFYRAPENVVLSGAAPYRELEGVDRRGGSSYVVFWGDRVPEPEEIRAAPTWLLDPAKRQNADAFEGGVETWTEMLEPGEPNKLVREAIARIPRDMGHSEMVAAQYNAIRLGAEGCPGVPELLDAIQRSWLSRPPANHSTPQDQWQHKFDEALESGIASYGHQVARLEALPTYSLELLPLNGPTHLFVGQPGDVSDFRRALHAIKDFDLTDDEVISLLWNSPRTRDVAREMGPTKVFDRVEFARKNGLPERENPTLPEEDAPVDKSLPREPLLTPEEKASLITRPTFVDQYLAAAARSGFVNEKYARASAWSVASMAFAFRGFIPVSESDKMGLNLWIMTMGYSGTGKTRAIKFRDAVLNVMFDGDGEVGYNLGSDSSPQGLHQSLLQRDRKASLLSADEASRFFKQLGKSDWMSSLDDTLAHWYEGRVDPSSKISLKELKGKSALTSFHISMFATPDRLTEVLTRDMFLTGFLARFNWVLGDPPLNTDSRFIMSQQDDPTTFDDHGDNVADVVLDLVHAATMFGHHPHPILATDEALSRMSRAHRQMYRQAEGGENWDIIEPSITRLAETVRKCAAICAMYRGSDTIDIYDARHAINAVQEWYDNLFLVASMISSGEFQRDCDDIESWLRVQKESRATRPMLLHKFRNLIQRDPRELDARLNFLVESGRINRKDESGKPTRYVINE